MDNINDWKRQANPIKEQATLVERVMNVDEADIFKFVVDTFEEINPYNRLSENSKSCLNNINMRYL